MTCKGHYCSNFMLGVTAWAKVDRICNVPIVKKTILIPDMNKDITKIQTSFIKDKKLRLKFKAKSLSEGLSIKEKLNVLISEYVKNKEKKNGSSWLRLPRW